MLLNREPAYAVAIADAEPTLIGVRRQLNPGRILPDDLLSALPWQAALLDQNGVIVGVNEAWRRFFIEDGASLRAANGHGLHYVDVSRQCLGLSEASAREVGAGIREVLAGWRSLFTLEYPYHSLAERRWFQLTATPLANGQPGALIQHIDITARKLAERERDEARAREWASREASRQMELFMAMASHEIRTPLTVIKLQMQLAERHLGATLPQSASATALTSPSAQESLTIAQRAANRLTSLLDDLLQVTNAKEGRLAVHPEWCDLVALVREQVAEHRQMHPTRRLNVHLTGLRHILIMVDPIRVTEVLTNFLNNACKYSPESRQIDVELSLEEGMAHLSVRDQGPGLSPDVQTHVWERFYQAPDIQPQSGGEPGLGLGLYISRVMVEQHGGKVGVDSVVGKGATFWCTLPLTARIA